ncbi:MAG: hypothetical protein OEY94_06385 [Alphaproteobacteria bacterium]|nr:hypothetical protein [Alphaproteobacteria bacterium]
MSEESQVDKALAGLKALKGKHLDAAVKGTPEDDAAVRGAVSPEGKFKNPTGGQGAEGPPSEPT